MFRTFINETVSSNNFSSSADSYIFYDWNFRSTARVWFLDIKRTTLFFSRYDSIHLGWSDDVFASDKILRTNVMHSFHVMSQLGCTGSEANLWPRGLSRAFDLPPDTELGKRSVLRLHLLHTYSICGARQRANFFTDTVLARICWLVRSSK